MDRRLLNNCAKFVQQTCYYVVTFRCLVLFFACLYTVFGRCSIEITPLLDGSGEMMVHKKYFRL